MTSGWAIIFGAVLFVSTHSGAASTHHSDSFAHDTESPTGTKVHAPALPNREATSLPVDPSDIIGYGVRQLSDYLSVHPVRNTVAVERFLSATIAPFFDFETMGRWTAGPFYRGLTPEERSRFHRKLQSLFIGALARNLGSYSTALPSVRILPPLPRRWGDEIVIRARVAFPRSYPVAIDFRFYRRDGAWRVFDVAANGFSAITYYRRHFAQLVRAHGPSVLTD